MKKTIVTAHSGCEGTAPNSMDHIRTALGTGAEMLEIDIRRSDGGLLYLSHDRPDAEPGNCVLFADFLDVLKESPAVRVNCDVKEDGLAAAVMEEANRRGMAGQIVFTGSCMGEEALIREAGGEFWYSIWDREDFEGAVKSLLKTGAKVLNLPCRFVTAENKARMDSLGLGFSCWTADSEEEIARLLTLGVYNVTTRKPRLALRLREEIQGD